MGVSSYSLEWNKMRLIHTNELKMSHLLSFSRCRLNSSFSSYCLYSVSKSYLCRYHTLVSVSMSHLSYLKFSCNTSGRMIIFIGFHTESNSISSNQAERKRIFKRRVLSSIPNVTDSFPKRHNSKCSRTLLEVHRC